MNKLRQLLTVLITGIVVFGAGITQASAAGPQCSPVHRAEMVQIAENYVEFYNNLGAAPYTSVYDENAVLASTAGVFDGVAQIEAIMSVVLQAIPDLHYTIEEVLVEGNKFTLRYRYTGTHLGDFMGIPASGNAISVYGLEINTVGEDGRIVHTHNFTDFYGLLVAMGAIAM